MAINAHDWITMKLGEFDFAELSKCKNPKEVTIFACNSFLLGEIVDACFDSGILPEEVEDTNEAARLALKILDLAGLLELPFRVYFTHKDRLIQEAEEEEYED